MSSIKIRLSSKVTSEYFFKILLFLIWGKNFIVSYIEAFLKKIPYISLVADTVIVVLYLIVIFLSLHYIVKRAQTTDFIFAFVVIAIVTGDLLFRNNEYFLWYDAYEFVIEIFSVYFIGLAIKEEHIEWLYHISVMSILIYLVYFTVKGDVMSASVALYQGNMDIAYKLMPHLCLVTYKVFENSKVALITAILGFVMLFSCGSRGPLLLYIAYLMVYVIFVKKNKKKSTNFIVIFGLIMLTINFNTIISLLNDFSLKIGMSNRIFEKFQAGSILDDSGRFILISRAIDSIKKNPFLGCGIAGDRLFLDESYSHNLFVELLVSFGIIAGTVMIIALLVCIVRGVKTSDNNIRIFIIALLFGSFLKLMLSGSYITEKNLFLLIGLCISQIRRER